MNSQRWGRNIFMIVIMIAAATNFVACAKKKSDKSAARAAAVRGEGAAVGAAVQGLPTSCSNKSQTAGRVYDDGKMGTNFRQAYADFLSAHTNPDEELGVELSGNPNQNETGVNIELRMKVTNGQIQAAQTAMSLIINDDESFLEDEDGGVVGPITADFEGAESAQFTSATGDFTLVFKDKWGSVTVTGRVNQNEARGTIAFANATSFNGKELKSGSLGAFYMPGCAALY